MILRPDSQDYQGTAVTVEIARKLETPNIFLVVNKAISYNKFDDFSALRQRVESSYKAPVIGILPLSEEMAILGSSDIFSLRYPNHPLTKVIENAVAQIEA